MGMFWRLVLFVFPFIINGGKEFWRHLYTGVQALVSWCSCYSSLFFWVYPNFIYDHRDRDRMVVRFITTYAISAYHHKRCEFESRSWRCVLATTLCDKVWQWLAAGPWIHRVLFVSSTNKTDRHDIIELLLRVALNTITLTLTSRLYYICTLFITNIYFI